MKLYNRHFLLFLSLLALSLGQSYAQDQRPNILVILCDDLGYSDVGFNGSQDIKTPTLDLLASQGTIMTSGYVAHPFCGPSRAAFMTGRYPHEYGAQFNLPPNSETIGKGIPLEETFISKVLQQSGYYTGIVGKWHLGANPEFHPNERGFDDFYGFLGGGHNYHPEEYEPRYKAQKEKGVEVIWDYLKPLEHNGVDIYPKEYLTDALSNHAGVFVKEAARKDKPFFLYLSYNAPHVPLEAKEEDLALFSSIKDEDRKTYAAMVYAVDRGVKDLIATLKETGEYENTLILFLSDNGGNLEHGATNFPLQEGKGSTHEGGYRVPMFFHWPGHIAEGELFDHPVSAIDFYPTFAALAQQALPQGKKIDGKNIWGDLMSGKNPHQNDMIYTLRHWEGYTDIGARKDEWKALKSGEKWELFNIVLDKSEVYDLSKLYPEKLKEMVKEVEEWSQSNAEPQWFTPLELEEIWKDKNMATFNDTFKIK